MQWGVERRGAAGPPEDPPPPGARPWTLAAVYVGAVVGAGFGSGREILHFFASHGAEGLWGCALAGLLFAALGRHVAATCVRHGIRDHRGLYARVLPPAAVAPLDHLTSLFLWLGLAAVLAGAGALARQQFGVPEDVGTLAMAATTAALLWNGRRGLVAANAVLSPAIAAFCAAAAVAGLARGGDLGPPPGGGGWPSQPPWFVDAFLYVGYNALLAVVALCAASPEAGPPRAARAAGLWAAVGGAGVGGLALAVTLALWAEYERAAPVPVPLLAWSAAAGPAWLAAYGGMYGAALLTTAVAAAYGAAARAGRGEPRRWHLLATVASAVPVARLGLVTLVGRVYPAAGAAGALLVAAVLWRAVSPPERTR
jgi:uncharacterized membrane protein YkvI